MLWIVSGFMTLWAVFEFWGQWENERTFVNKNGQEVFGKISNWDALMLKRQGWRERIGEKEK